MKAKIILFLLFLSFCPFCVAQHIPFVIKKTDTINTKQIDSTYKIAIGNKGVFQKNEDILVVKTAWGQMLSDFSDFLYDQKYHWRFDMQLFCTAYFSKEKTVDYFYYNFDKNFLLPKDEEAFVLLITQFLQTYQLQLPLDTKTAFKISGSMFFD